MTTVVPEIQVGNRAKLQTSTKFQDSAGVEFDPDIVRFIVTDPSGSTATYVFGTDSNVTNPSVGEYVCEVDVEVSGRWYYRIEGETSGSVNRGADEREFVAPASNVG